MTELKLTVIGECSGAPTAGHATSCYLVSFDGYNLLLDLGSGALAILQETVDFDSINDVIISHFHADHVADCGAAIYHRLIRHQLGEAVEPLVFHSMEERDLVMDGASTVKTVSEDTVETIGPFTVHYLRTDHPVPTLACRLEAGGKSLVYTADGFLTEELIKFSLGADILIAECSFYPGQGEGKAGHMNADAVLRLACAARPGTLVCSHLPIYGDRTEILGFIKKGYDAKVVLASPLLEVRA